MAKEQHTHVCPWWAAYFFDNPLRKLIHNTSTILGPYLGPGMKALDVGCGMGFFSIGMAGIVGDGGTVYALDIQEKMLEIASKRAARKGLDSRIAFSLIEPDSLGPDRLGIEKIVDFVLAFWVVHEVPDQDRLFSEIHEILRPGGNFLMTEPSFHVKKDQVDRSIERAESAGLTLTSRPNIRLSGSALFVKPYRDK